MKMVAALAPGRARQIVPLPALPTISVPSRVAVMLSGKTRGWGIAISGGGGGEGGAAAPSSPAATASPIHRARRMPRSSSSGGGETHPQIVMAESQYPRAPWCRRGLAPLGAGHHVQVAQVIKGRVARLACRSAEAPRGEHAVHRPEARHMLGIVPVVELLQIGRAHV